MDIKAIISDIEKICLNQRINIKNENSIRFILEDDCDFLGGYDISKFRKFCRWEDINSLANPDGTTSALYPLSNDFIEYFIKDLGWYKISRNIKLSENFIEKYQDNVNWQMISQFQKLSENFIEKYQHKVKWDKISIGQTHLSEDFIWKHRERLSINNVYIFYKSISPQFKERIRPYRWD